MGAEWACAPFPFDLSEIQIRSWRGAEWVCGRFQFDLSETQSRMWFYAGSVCGRFPRFERQRRRLRKTELRKLPKFSF